jgi:limonene-1,2-epoxide hydrolase
MGVEHEAVVRAFLSEWEEGDQLDSAQIDRVVEHLSEDARYHVFAWEDPHVGHEAIRTELLRQLAQGLRGVRFEVVTIGSVGPIVFTERRDVTIHKDKQVTIHVAGVF